MNITMTKEEFVRVCNTMNLPFSKAYKEQLRYCFKCGFDDKRDGYEKRGKPFKDYADVYYAGYHSAGSKYPFGVRFKQYLKREEAYARKMNAMSLTKGSPSSS